MSKFLKHYLQINPSPITTTKRKKIPITTINNTFIIKKQKIKNLKYKLKNIIFINYYKKPKSKQTILI